MNGCAKWPVGVIVAICAALDVCLAAFLKACIDKCPEILIEIVLKYDKSFIFSSLIIANSIAL